MLNFKIAWALKCVLITFLAKKCVFYFHNLRLVNVNDVWFVSYYEYSVIVTPILHSFIQEINRLMLNWKKIY